MLTLNLYDFHFLTNNKKSAQATTIFLSFLSKVHNKQHKLQVHWIYIFVITNFFLNVRH